MYCHRAARAGCVGLLWLFAACRPAPPSTPPGPPTASARASHVAPADSAGKTPHSAAQLLIVNWDGMSAAVIQPLLDRGRLPNFQSIVERGAFGPIETITPTFSPVVWTTIATGKSPQEHGITHFHHSWPGVEGRVLFDSRFRRVNALWNILSERGISSGFIGWWVSWPVEPIRGVMVSDRYVFNRTRLGEGEVLPGDVGERRDQVYPESLHAALEPLVLQPQSVTTAEMERFIYGMIAVPPQPVLHDPEDELRLAYAQDESHLRFAEYLLSRPSPPRVLAVHLQGTDTVCHHFWRFRFADDWSARFKTAVEPAEVKRYGGAINAYYEYADSRLGDLLRRLDADATVLILADHGFVPGRKLRKAGNRATVISGVHEQDTRPPGLIAAAGPGIAPRAAISGATVYDIFPTVLALAGCPLPKDIRGQPIDAIVGPSRRAALTFVETYDRSLRPLPEDVRVTPGDSRRREQLDNVYLDDSGNEIAAEPASSQAAP